MAFILSATTYVLPEFPNTLEKINTCFQTTDINMKVIQVFGQYNYSGLPAGFILI